MQSNHAESLLNGQVSIKIQSIDLYGGKSFKLVLDFKRPRYLQGCLITDENIGLNVHKQDFTL